MHKFVTVLLGATALSAATAASAASTIDFSTPTGNVGSSTHTYVATGAPTLFVVATGYNAANAQTYLYGKNGGGDEIGLGLNADPALQGEIFKGAWVQLDVSDLFGKATSVLYNLNSTTANEQWEVYGSNVAGSLGTALLYGINDEATHDLLSLGGLGWGNYTYYNFRSLGTGTGGIEGLANAAPGNVLLGNLVVTAVPEPSTWAMMLLGFGAMGFAARRSRKKVVMAQLA